MCMCKLQMQTRTTHTYTKFQVVCGKADGQESVRMLVLMGRMLDGNHCAMGRRRLSSDAWQSARESRRLETEREDRSSFALWFLIDGQQILFSALKMKFHNVIWEGAAAYGLNICIYLISIWRLAARDLLCEMYILCEIIAKANTHTHVIQRAHVKYEAAPSDGFVSRRSWRCLMRMTGERWRVCANEWVCVYVCFHTVCNSVSTETKTNIQLQHQCGALVQWNTDWCKSFNPNLTRDWLHI